MNAAKSELNHVSVVAEDLDESTEFYCELFNMERVPTPDFGFDVRWLAMDGGRQLHLFSMETPPSRYNHFGLTVNNFEEIYHEAKRRDILTESTDTTGSPNLYKLPDGAVQMYVEDPVGNLVEVNCPNITTLDEAVRKEIVDREDQRPQTGEARTATLGLTDFF